MVGGANVDVIVATVARRDVSGCRSPAGRQLAAGSSPLALEPGRPMPAMATTLHAMPMTGPAIRFQW